MSSRWTRAEPRRPTPPSRHGSEWAGPRSRAKQYAELERTVVAQVIRSEAARSSTVEALRKARMVRVTHPLSAPGDHPGRRAMRHAAWCGVISRAGISGSVVPARTSPPRLQGPHWPLAACRGLSMRRAAALMIVALSCCVSGADCAGALVSPHIYVGAPVVCTVDGTEPQVTIARRRHRRRRRLTSAWRCSPSGCGPRRAGCRGS